MKRNMIGMSEKKYQNNEIFLVLNFANKSCLHQRYFDVLSGSDIITSTTKVNLEIIIPVVSPKSLFRFINIKTKQVLSD